MGGIEATGIIRQYEADENIERIPIIALTAHAMLGDRERVREPAPLLFSIRFS